MGGSFYKAGEVYTEVVAHSIHPDRTSVLTTVQLDFPVTYWKPFHERCVLAGIPATAIRTPYKEYIRREVDVYRPASSGGTRSHVPAQASGRSLVPYTPINLERAMSDWDYRALLYVMRGQITQSAAARALEAEDSCRVLATSTHWRSLLALCLHEEIRGMQECLVGIAAALRGSRPQQRKRDDWHLPYISSDERGGSNMFDLAHISAARCVRLHVHRRVNDTLDVNRGIAYKKLQQEGDLAICVHQARPYQRSDPPLGKRWHLPDWTSFEDLLFFEQGNPVQEEYILDEDMLHVLCRSDKDLVKFIMSLRT